MPAPLAALAPPIVAGVGSLVGGYMGNRASRKEGKRNRRFQERMRNTQWQAAVADMEAAGINPALAYSQGPNAAPGGSMASQQDAVSPAISSAMQMKRLTADLKQIQASTQKLKTEERGAREVANLARARNLEYGYEGMDTGSMRVKTDPSGSTLLGREMRAGILRAENQAIREGHTGRALAPLADLADSMGQALPILGLISQFSPGGLLKRGVAKGSARAAKTRATTESIRKMSLRMARRQRR